MSRFVIALIVLVFVVAMASATDSYDSSAEESDFIVSAEAAASPLDNSGYFLRVRRSPQHGHGGHYGGGGHHHGGGHYGGHHHGGHYGGGYGHGHGHHHHGYGR